MNLFKKIGTCGAMILVSSFGLTLSATASDFSDSLLKANQGDSHSQLVVAKAYMYGEGVQQSNEKGFEWALKSANQGNLDGQFIVGALYDMGQGVRQDNAKAYEWYLDAVINGDKDSFSAIDTMHDEGRISQQDYSTAREIVYGPEPSFDFVTGTVSDSSNVKNAYRKACDKGSRVGCLSIMSALDYFKKLADEGNMEDQHRLGVMYLEGDGVDRNYEKAFTYLLKAAKQGNGNAQAAVGWMYSEGKGVSLDEEESLFWSNKACSKGDEIACTNYKTVKASRSRSNDPAPRIYQNTAQPSQRFVPIQIPQRSSYLLPGAP